MWILRKDVEILSTEQICIQNPYGGRKSTLSNNEEILSKPTSNISR
jgi:hypothetical protein